MCISSAPQNDLLGSWSSALPLVLEIIQSKAPPSVSIGFHNHLARFSSKVIAVRLIMAVAQHTGNGLVVYLQ